jgi:hypothetical protein
VGQVYNNRQGSVWNVGDIIPVSLGSVVEDIDAVLQVGGEIRGRVTNTSGDPIANINVQSVYRISGSSWSWGRSTTTDSNGEYVLRGLGAGNYRVEFRDWDQGVYAHEYFDDHAEIEDADDIFVPASSVVSNINASLKEYAMISGRITQSDGVTPIRGVRVWAHGVWESGQSDANGFYSINRLRPDAYYLRAEPSSRSPFLGQWYDGELFMPIWDWWNASPPGGATAVSLSSGETRGDVDFHLDRGAQFSGTVTGSGIVPLEGARVLAVNESYNWMRSATTDSGGSYELVGLLPGGYVVKAEAEGFRDEWWNNKNHRDDAQSFPAAVEQSFLIDFDLEPGQSPAYAYVDSQPQGAHIYLDYQPTGLTTPNRVDLGEAGSHARRAAPRAISVRMDNYPWPVPYDIYPIEAETIDLDFDLENITEIGSVEVDTSPSGADVWLDYTDIYLGTTPVVVSNLEAGSGSHRLFLRKPGYLKPAPIDLAFGLETNLVVNIPLTPDDQPSMAVSVLSIPPGADIYIDYLSVSNVTDVRVAGLDMESHEGSGWRSASHTVLLHREGYLRPLARYLDVNDGDEHVVLINLISDTLYFEQFADPELFRYENWANAYGGTDAIGGPSDDPFSKGMSNLEQMLAGLDPSDPDSRFEFHDWVPMSSENGGFRIEWPSVPGKMYVVEYTDDLRASWTNISGLFTATEYVSSVTDMTPLSESGRFYRVRVLP